MLQGKANLVFIGFMGSGKSMVSNMLGKKLGKTVLSTDELIVTNEGRTIAEIFEQSGEPHFRDLEREAVKIASQQRDVIIDCGGGVILDQDNIDILKDNGCLIYLAASPEFLLEQIQQQPQRPLLIVDDPLAKIKELLEQRKGQYKQADVTLVSEDRTVDEICEEIIELIKND